jgi:hypothetical protein
MALDPRISLASLAPQVQMPDFVNTAQIAQQMQAQQQQQQMRMFQLSELLRQRQQEMDVDQYLGQMTGPQAAAGPATRPGVPPAVQGSYAQNPAQSPTRDYDQLSPGTQAPPGTTYGVAPEGMQAPAVTPPAATRPSPEGLLAKGRPGREAYAAYTQGQMRQMEASQEQMKTSLMGMQYLNQRLSLPRDESSYQAVLADLTSKQPALADMLPKHYDPKVIAEIQASLQRGLAKGQQQRLGLDIHQGVRDGKIVPLQASTAGGMVEPELPPGVKYLPTTRQQNLPTEIRTVDPLGREITTTPKNITGAAQQRATGTKVGEEEGQRPQRMIQAQTAMDRLDAKHEVTLKAIDEAINTIDTRILPAGGPVGSWLAGKTPAATNLKTQLETIGANLGLDELVNLKNSNGTTLTPVSDKDVRLLTTSSATIQQEQDERLLRQHLVDLKKELTGSKQRRYDAFRRDFIDRPTTGQSQRQPTLEEVEAAIARKQRSMSGGQ